MTETPQITRIMMNSHDGPPKANPIARAQAPDAIIIPAVVAVRPIRSDRIPPRRQPNAPVPIVTKVRKDARPSNHTCWAPRASFTYTRSHAHIAYSSHIMSEIAEIGQEEISIAENSPSLPRIEYSASKGIGSLAGEEPKKHSSDRRGKGGYLNDKSPIHRSGKTAKKMRHGRSDG